MKHRNIYNIHGLKFITSNLHICICINITIRPFSFFTFLIHILMLDMYNWKSADTKTI